VMCANDPSTPVERSKSMQMVWFIFSALPHLHSTLMMMHASFYVGKINKKHPRDISTIALKLTNVIKPLV